MGKVKQTQKTDLMRRLATLLIAGLGATLFWVTGLPLPLLFGPMLACLLAALLGTPLLGLGWASIPARTIIGVAVGATVTPALITQLPQMIASVAFIPLYVIVIGLIGVPYFSRVCGFDRVTAYYAAMPGGLQDMVIFGQEAGGNVRTLSLVHATRVLIIITIAPIVLSQGFGIPLNNPIGSPAADIPTIELILMAIAAIVGWKGGEAIGLFGATILGPMIVTGVLSLTGLVHFRPPAEALLTAQFFIGIGIGVGYVGVTLREMRRDVLAGIFYVFILVGLAAIFTSIVVMIGLANPVAGFLAFAPAGQAEITVLTIIAGADLGFVIVHHIVRVLLVITGAPIMAGLLKISKKRKP